jgi:hypothetical protein
MRFPFMLRARHDAELAAAKAETDRQRRRAKTAESHAATAVFNRKQVLRQNADLDAANRRLEGRNLELGRRISQLTEADPEYAARLEQRITRLRHVAARILAKATTETRRADLLQARLDDACGLNSSAVMDGRYWQQTRHDGGRKQAAS